MSRQDRRGLAGLALWLCAAVAFVGIGGLRWLAPPFPQLVLALLLLLLVAGWILVPPFRGWLSGLEPSAVLSLHLFRFVGLYFLVLFRRGELPYEFAVVGGWGDIVVASGALVLLLAPPAARAAGSPWLQGWNLLGLVDILFVVTTAGRLAITAPESMSALVSLPLGLLPTFLVPLILFTHLLIAAAGLRARRRVSWPRGASRP